MTTATAEAMAAETVALAAKEFQRQNGNAFAFLSNEIKNAMLLRHCMTAKIASTWHKDELVALLAVCHDWYK